MPKRGQQEARVVFSSLNLSTERSFGSSSIDRVLQMKRPIECSGEMLVRQAILCCHGDMLVLYSQALSGREKSGVLMDHSHLNEPMQPASHAGLRSRLTRRSFLQVSSLAAGGFALGLYIPEQAGATASSLGAQAQLNAFVKIASDGRITIFAHNPEIGQGIKTSLPMVVAEELGARWSDVDVLQSPIDEATFGRHYVGGSTTINRCFDQMRQVGASARTMLIGAATKQWSVPAQECSTDNSAVVHTPSGRKLEFAKLASLAASQPVPDLKSLKFKDRKDYKLLGTRVSGVDNHKLVTGEPLFGVDTVVPGMVFAAYQKCPAIFGKVKSANLDSIKSMPGVLDAFVLEGNGDAQGLLPGIAIVGNSTWAVFKAKRSLQVEWDETSASRDSWTQIKARAASIAGQQGESVIAEIGDVDAQFTRADNKTLKAYYEYPFAYHATLEPMNCTAHFKEANGAKSLEVWVPTQVPDRIFPAAQRLFGVDAKNVTIHQTRLGGSFGRRGSPEFVCEAAAISQRMKKPVKLTWTREDDAEHDFFRVGGFQSLRGAVDNAGKLVAWENHFIGMSTNGESARGSNFAASEFPMLNVSNVRGTRTSIEIKTPCGPWRAPGANTMAFPVQSFIHELALAAGRDHLEFLIEIMGEPRWFQPGNLRSLNTARAVDVLKLVGEKAGWGRSMPKGHGLGLAFHFCHAAHIAEIAEVSVDENRKVKVHRVTVAADVGPIINMSGATAQVEGSVIDGLSTMLSLEITMEKGRIQQTNFDRYSLLRIKDAPVVDVHFLQSDNVPTGLGEPALPPLAPAVANAIFAATGHRIRTMPINKDGFTV
jgi:isoquinoline 1-oxidoreductase beta subunit